MTNRFLGETKVAAGGKDYTLRCDFNAMCHFEDATGKDALEAFAQFEKGKARIKDMRAMMWALLQHHHPDMTLAEAGAIMSENVDAMMDAIAAASPQAAEVGDLGNEKKAATS